MRFTNIEYSWGKAQWCRADSGHGYTHRLHDVRPTLAMATLIVCMMSGRLWSWLHSSFACPSLMKHFSMVILWRQWRKGGWETVADWTQRESCWATVKSMKGRHLFPLLATRMVALISWGSSHLIATLGMLGKKWQTIPTAVLADTMKVVNHKKSGFYSPTRRENFNYT